MRAGALAAAAALLLPAADAYRSFQSKIPSGDRVPCRDVFADDVRRHTTAAMSPPRIAARLLHC